MLQRGEVVKYRGTLSPAIYLPALAIACLAAMLAGMSIIMPWPLGWLFVAVLLLLATTMALNVSFKRWTTELAVTDRRVSPSTARGFINRQSVEMRTCGKSKVSMSTNRSSGVFLISAR